MKDLMSLLHKRPNMQKQLLKLIMLSKLGFDVVDTHKRELNIIIKAITKSVIVILKQYILRHHKNILKNPKLLLNHIKQLNKKLFNNISLFEDIEIDTEYFSHQDQHMIFVHFVILGMYFTHINIDINFDGKIRLDYETHIPQNSIIMLL